VARCADRAGSGFAKGNQQRNYDEKKKEGMKTKDTAITILGLGPGSWEAITRQAYEVLTRAQRERTPVYVRTLLHPTIEPLQADLPDLRLASFDALYEEADDWETLYQNIMQRICTQAASEPVIYAVPGHPLIGEYSVSLILRQARIQGLSTSVVSGLSFLEPVCAALEMDPFTQGVQILDATALAMLSREEIAGKLIPTMPLFIVQIYNRRVASSVKIALGECYPDEWSVKLVRAAGVEQEESVVEMPLYDLDRNRLTNLLCTLYVPPRREMETLNLPETLRVLTTRLHQNPAGFGSNQTYETLKRTVIEEVHAVVGAIEEQNSEHLAEELGDLLFQIYHLVEVARLDGMFSLGEVFEQINTKLLHHYPQVFSSARSEQFGTGMQPGKAINKENHLV
jgi:tetrapyrrole methylase family protein/MazG family protein